MRRLILRVYRRECETWRLARKCQPTEADAGRAVRRLLQAQRSFDLSDPGYILRAKGVG